MAAFDHKAFFDAVRPFFGGRLVQRQVDIFNKAIDESLAIAPLPGGLSPEPVWLAEGRGWIGVAEIPGPQNNSKIVEMRRKLGSWMLNDDDPWCGDFVAHCMQVAGQQFPKTWYRAKDWEDWGEKCPAQVGAVGVKSRVGGGHVFLIVGETPDKRFYKALGGNQGNRVSVMDILKAETYAVRWPVGVPQPLLPLPVMAPGTISKNEA